jgi:heme-degrading monooxygenase HmoA
MGGGINKSAKAGEEMIHIVWEFLVRADRLPEFERYYSGVDGPWAQLFRKSPGFRGTVLLRDTQVPRRFLTIDSWDTVDAQVTMRQEFHGEYTELDKACEELTESEGRVGVFEDLAGGESKTTTI